MNASVYEMVHSAPDGAGSRRRFARPRVNEIRLEITVEDGETRVYSDGGRYGYPSVFGFLSVLDVEGVVRSLTNSWAYYRSAKEAREAYQHEKDKRDLA